MPIQQPIDWFSHLRSLISVLLSLLFFATEKSLEIMFQGFSYWETGDLRR